MDGLSRPQDKWKVSQKKIGRGSRFGLRKIDEGYQADGAQKQLRGIEECSR